MRLYVDLDTLAISDFRNSAVTSLTAKRSDRFQVQVRFQSNGVVQELPHGATGRIVIKKVSDYSGYPVAWSPQWRKIGYGASAYYVFNLNLHTEQVVDQFLTLQGELPTLTLAFEIQWQHRGMRRSSRSVNFVVENDYVRLEDEAEPPILIPDPPVGSPVIGLIGDSQITVNLGEAFVDPGANVTDNYDAPRVIYGAGTVNTSVPGTYFLKYTALDAAENKAIPVTRVIVVPDPIPPTISLIGGETINLSVGDTFTDPGAVVADNVDADRTIYGVGAVDTAVPGTYTLSYAASDAAGNAAALVARAVVVSNPAP